MAEFTQAGTQQVTKGIAQRVIPLALWGSVIFLSAFLLFAVQPILAKAILPWFGGTAGVWTVSLMFFQITYLLGNLYAHWMEQGARSRWQPRVHTLLLGASLLLLPIVPRGFWKPVTGADPTWRILGLLTVTIGLPFLLLSATSPLLQTWYRRERGGAQPYRFYALSNAGSLLALLSYPVVIEPFLGTRHQAVGWSYAYGAFAVLCGVIALARPAGAVPAERVASAPRPGWQVQLLWVFLAADASALLLAVTNYISQNVAAVPLLWIVPLSLYLLSLILCFEGERWYHRFLFLRLAAVALGGMAFAFSPEYANAGPMLQIPLFCAGLFVCCMACHGELAKLKPSPEHLTLFYLMVSLGGALGGIFVGVVAPHAFRGFYELPVAMAGCAILLWIVLHRDPSTVFYKARTSPPSLVFTGVVALFLVSLFVVSRGPSVHARLMARNFYGVLRVRDLPRTESEPTRRELLNGTIVHGVEILDPDRKDRPTTYYGPDSGAGRALLWARERGKVRAGFIGLGTGTLASYGQTGDRFTFYEINPLVIRVAIGQFDFLRDSPADVEIVPGDARLSLEREPPQDFNVLVVDAFSGDAIPVHLLTVEAIRLYFHHLAPDGVLAIHISNKFLNLRPVVEAAVDDLNAFSSVVVNGTERKNEIFTSTWVLVSKSGEVLSEGGFPASTMIGKQTNLKPWTDDYSNLLRILK
jgi:hypothetical protein